MDHLNLNVKDQVNFAKKKKQAKKSSYKEEESLSDIERVRDIIKKNAKKKPNKRPFPIKVVAGSLSFLSILAVVNFYLDDAINFFEKLNIKVSPIAASSAQDNKPKVANQQEPAKALATKDKTSWTEEEIKIFQGLEQKKTQLDQREKSLNALSEELARQKDEIAGKLTKLESLREEISFALSGEVEKDEERLMKLVDVYSNMKPKIAAKLFEEIDEKLAIQVLAKMKKQNAANILNNIEPDKARRLSEKYAGFMKK